MTSQDEKQISDFVDDVYAICQVHQQHFDVLCPRPRDRGCAPVSLPVFVPSCRPLCPFLSLCANRPLAKQIQASAHASEHRICDYFAQVPRLLSNVSVVGQRT